MCEPVSMGTALVTGAGMAVNAIGTAKQAKAQIKAGTQQAIVSEANARMLEEQAELRLEKAKFEIDARHRNYRRERGAARAKIASSGVDARSFYDVLLDDAAEAALERKALKWEAEQEAAYLRYQAWGERQEGKAALQGAKSSAEATYLNGISQGVQMAAPFLKGAGPTIGSSTSGWSTTVTSTGLK